MSLTRFIRNAQSRFVLRGMFIDKFVEVDDSIYDTIRKIKAKIR